MKYLEEFIRIEEMEGMEAVVGPELAVVVDDKDDDDVNVDAFDREATDETTSDGALEGGAPDGPEGGMDITILVRQFFCRCIYNKESLPFVLPGNIPNEA